MNPQLELRVRCAIAVVLPFALACTPSPATPAGSLLVTVDSSGGVPVITVNGEAPSWSLDSLAVIRLESDVGFSDIRSIALDPRGGVWVADVGEQRVSRWSDEGTWLEDKGGEGSGPGEFQTPYSIAVHDDGLFVLDIFNSRIVRFDLPASTDSSWLIPSRVTGGAVDVRLFPDPAGPRYMNYLRYPEPAVTFVRVTDSTDIVIQPATDDKSGASQVKICKIEDGIRFFGSPFAPAPFRSPWQAWTVATANGDYQLDRFGRDSKHLSTIRRPVERDSITDAEFESATADWRKFQAESPAANCEGEIVRYRSKPAIRALFPDDDGRLWVEQRLMGGGLRFEVWSGDSLVGALPAPERQEELPPAIAGDRIAVVVESPDGGHEVRLYRVRRPN